MIKDLFLANNQMTSLNVFEFRKIYRDNVLQSVGDKKIDMWYDVPMYGKVDFKNFAVYLSESNLKQLNGKSENTLLALDFAVDAFDDLQSYFEKARTLKRINLFGPISEMVPLKSWISATNLHHVHIDSIYKLFVLDFIRSNALENKIKNFEDFVNEFLLFVDEIKYYLPITRSSFVKSKFCSPLTSGLVIEIEDKDRDNDKIKQKDILDDPNFIFFKEAAKRYGFFIDKNVPWRLVCDIMSPVTKKYMSNYGIDSIKLFSSYYYKALDYDLDVLKNYMIQMWNSWSASYPFSKDIRENCLGQKLLVTISKREQYNVDFPIFDDNKWIEIYARIRFKESLKDWDEFEISRKIKTAIDLKKHLDKNGNMEHTLGYIDQESNK